MSFFNFDPTIKAEPAKLRQTSLEHKVAAAAKTLTPKDALRLKYELEEAKAAAYRAKYPSRPLPEDLQKPLVVKFDPEAAAKQLLIDKADLAQKKAERDFKSSPTGRIMNSPILRSWLFKLIENLVLGKSIPAFPSHEQLARENLRQVMGGRAGVLEHERKIKFEGARSNLAPEITTFCVLDGSSRPIFQFSDFQVVEKFMVENCFIDENAGKQFMLAVREHHMLKILDKGGNE